MQDNWFKKIESSETRLVPLSEDVREPAPPSLCSPPLSALPHMRMLCEEGRPSANLEAASHQTHLLGSSEMFAV